LGPGLKGEHLKTLPMAVKRRVRALENLQQQYGALERQYREELAELERKYDALYAPLYRQRSSVVRGEHEPTDAECAGFVGEPEGAPSSDVRGIPLFWYYALSNSDTFVQLTGLNERDREALSYLTDITYTMLPRRREVVPVTPPSGTSAAPVQSITADTPGAPAAASATKEVVRVGFTLTFSFLDNPFFSDKTLTKTYYLTEDEDGSPMFDRAEALVSLLFLSFFF